MAVCYTSTSPTQKKKTVKRTISISFNPKNITQAFNASLGNNVTYNQNNSTLNFEKEISNGVLDLTDIILNQLKINYTFNKKKYGNPDRHMDVDGNTGKYLSYLKLDFAPNYGISGSLNFDPIITYKTGSNNISITCFTTESSSFTIPENQITEDSIEIGINFGEYKNSHWYTTYANLHPDLIINREFREFFLSKYDLCIYADNLFAGDFYIPIILSSNQYTGIRVALSYDDIENTDMYINTPTSYFSKPTPGITQENITLIPDIEFIGLLYTAQDFESPYKTVAFTLNEDILNSHYVLDIAYNENNEVVFKAIDYFTEEEFPLEFASGNILTTNGSETYFQMASSYDISHGANQYIFNTPSFENPVDILQKKNSVNIHYDLENSRLVFRYGTNEYANLPYKLIGADDVSIDMPTDGTTLQFTPGPFSLQFDSTAELPAGTHWNADRIFAEGELTLKILNEHEQTVMQITNNQSTYETIEFKNNGNSIVFTKPVDYTYTFDLEMNTSGLLIYDPSIITVNCSDEQVFMHPSGYQLPFTLTFASGSEDNKLTIDTDTYPTNVVLAFTFAMNSSVPFPEEYADSYGGWLIRDLAYGEYMFKLIDENGDAIAGATNTAEGLVQFDTIELEHPMNITYTIEFIMKQDITDYMAPKEPEPPHP